MKALNCIIIEDEPLAAEIIEDYIKQVSSLKFIAHFSNALEAIRIIQNHSIDVIFLDLHLPALKGFDFLRTLVNPPQVIVTTAYPNYALEGYEMNIVDYLTKPIEFPRFLKAVNKLNHAKDSTTNILETTIKVIENRVNVPVKLKEILFIESQNDLITFHLDSKEVITKDTLQAVLELLPSSHFLRIHRSFIIAINRIDSFSSSKVKIGNQELPIGRSYKELVDQKLKAEGF